jgi:hypothetical protein
MEHLNEFFDGPQEPEIKVKKYEPNQKTKRKK